MKRIVPAVAMALLATLGIEAAPQADPKCDQPITCPVSGEKLGDMGTPVSIDYQGKKIAFCCDSCIAKFRKDSAKYLSKLPAKP